MCATTRQVCNYSRARFSPLPARKWSKLGAHRFPAQGAEKPNHRAAANLRAVLGAASTKGPTKRIGNAPAAAPRRKVACIAAATMATILYVIENGRKCIFR